MYEKPELFVLRVAAGAVRSYSTDGPGNGLNDTIIKMATPKESGSITDRTGNNNATMDFGISSSSSTGAYEADE